MIQEKELNYRKSIKFELIRAKIAFDEYYSLVSVLTGRKFTDVTIMERVRLYDTYARWCGHLYESLLALVKIEELNDVNESSKSPATDTEIQWEAKKSINRFNSSVEAGRINADGIISPSLEDDFSKSLRIVRNRCSFHCTHNRVHEDYLKSFHERHHHMAYWIFREFSGLHADIESIDDADLGEINNFCEFLNVEH